MPAADDLLQFGPFLLDPRTRVLTRDGERVPLGARQMDILCLLASQPGKTLPKDTVIQHAWPDVAVTIGSVDQALFVLRKALTMPSAEPVIETRTRRGVCFVAAVQRVARREPEASVDQILAANRAWIEGRAALESLKGDAIPRARAAFEGILATTPDHAPAHVGLANALALQFEMHRTDPSADDVAGLKRAYVHAQEAVRLQRRYAEAWATLGFVIERVVNISRAASDVRPGNSASAGASTGSAGAKAVTQDDAIAALHEAVRLEPDNWRHHLRLAAATWGETRIRAARQALQLNRDLPMAHWLVASVFVARQQLNDAQRELEIGLGLSDTSAPAPPRIATTGLNWLLGLILLATGDCDGAVAAFERELTNEDSGHLYAREVTANAKCSLNVLLSSNQSALGVQLLSKFRLEPIQNR